MVDEHAVAVDGVEHDGLVGELLTHRREEGAAGAGRAARVGGPGDVVEDDGAGALEDVAVALVVREVDDLVHLLVGGNK